MKKWTSLDSHRSWLFAQANAILDFYQYNAVNPEGGFFDLDDDARPLPTGWPPAPEKATNLFQTTRMVHCFALAQLMGRPGAMNLVDHGMRHLWEVHRDTKNGGYYWANGLNGPVSDSKQHYGHAFVLLAASSAKLAGHPDADRLLADATEVLDKRFWEETHGAGAEEFTADWQPVGPYRGQNSNMHLTEALMAAFEVTGERIYIDKALSIAGLLIDRITRSNEWRLAEHFDTAWKIDYDYDQDVFRPYGSTIGHWLEWTRLLLQLWSLTGRRHDWLREAARNLFRNACSEGWDKERGGFYFTVGWKGEPVDRDRYWWPCTEGIGAAHFLNDLEDDPFYESWYRRIWDWCDAHLIDHRLGGWFHQLNDALVPVTDPWFGKPDIYHAFQACIIPLLPTDGSCGMGLKKHGIILSGGK
ncbi:AGE family epimerase/isomerase [Martelella mediterranea]|uniref:AGE family epimerase/isomerase n=1 Tax=Martelella mediterranea TaxID=293089 RepID=UPI001E38896C|nr:AGE family epimerase/isomerase [Martelella mediterranea]MCD1635794.1 AGE family epimerase/isomerase [Martelella mediterranea]